MQELEIKCYFELWTGETSEDVIGGIEFPDHLCDALQKIYQETQEINLQTILDSGQLYERQEDALERIIKKLKNHPVSQEVWYGYEMYRDASGEYDHLEVAMEFEIIPPDEWDVIEVAPPPPPPAISYKNLTHAQKLELAQTIADAVVYALKEQKIENDLDDEEEEE